MLAASIAAVGVLGIPAWWLSDAPRGVAIVMALAGLVASLVLARRELSRTVLTIVLQGNGTASIDGDVVERLDVSWRGSLVALCWHSKGRARRRLAFPDAIDAVARRELRLWALRRREDAPAAAVAP